MTQTDVWNTVSRHDPAAADSHPYRTPLGLDWYHRDGLCYGAGGVHPAFLFWEAPPVDPAEDAGKFLLHWADGRCFLCGFIDHLVEDHDHETGRTRGHICRSCNSGEPHSDHPAIVAWRGGVNPVAIFDLDRYYSSPITGETPLSPTVAAVSDDILDEIAAAMV